MSESAVRIDEVLVSIYRITLRYIIGLNDAADSLEVIREELRKLRE